MKLKSVFDEITIDRLGIISEAGLSRLLSMAQNRDFCIATGFRYGNTLAQNRTLNKELNSMLNAKKMGGYSLIGHWQEAPDGIEYKDANPEDLTDSIEESVLFTRPNEMPLNDFVRFCAGVCLRFNQDAVVLGVGSHPGGSPDRKTFKLHNESKFSLTEDDIAVDSGVYLIFKNGSMDKIGSSLTLGKVSQAYSRMKKKPNIPFVFEGILQPTSNMSKMAFKSRNIKYLV